MSRSTTKSPGVLFMCFRWNLRLKIRLRFVYGQSADLHKCTRKFSNALTKALWAFLLASRKHFTDFQSAVRKPPA